MSTSDRFARGDWPSSMMAPAVTERERLVNQTVELLSLEPVRPTKSDSHWRARIDIVKAALSLLAHELIPMAEQLIGATGPERKARITQDILKLVDALQARVKLGPFNTLAWWLIRRSVSGLIELAFRQLEARGVVNVGLA